MDESGKYLTYRSYLITIVVIVVCSLFVLTSRNEINSALLSSSFDKRYTAKSEFGTSSPSPNVVFILADDLGWSDIGTTNASLGFVMPTLMQMAEQGIRMTSYYSQESCTPARASLLTGRYPLTVGMQFGDVDTEQRWGLNLTEILLPEVLRDQGNYGTYIIGKWNLGHFSPYFLPTARGFDYFMGYLSGQVYYWSKRVPQFPKFTDLMYANTECYEGYNGSDMHDYSTFLFRDKAVDVIMNHDFDSQPMFLYFASQAVHDPFFDRHMYKSGIPPEYLDDDLYAAIKADVVGRKRRQYAMSLALLDGAVLDICNALEDVGQMNNTYIIFTSDNGGCYESGGTNGDLRGSKGSLYEGGTKVDAFIYSPLISSNLVGTQYEGIMHVSDWFPTILDMVGIEYTSPVTLDGVSQLDAIMGGGPEKNSRSTLLYNFYINVDREDFSMDSSPVGIRNARYKLLQAYDANDAALWYPFDETVEDDDSLLAGTCGQTESMTGNYIYYLFDLLEDPNETKNLFDIGKYATIKAELYAELSVLRQRSREQTFTTSTKIASETWKENGNYVSPWALVDDAAEGAPRQCSFYGTVVSPIYTNTTTEKDTSRIYNVFQSEEGEDDVEEEEEEEEDVVDATTHDDDDDDDDDDSTDDDSTNEVDDDDDDDDDDDNDENAQ